MAKFEPLELDLPTFWASALINGDESSFALDETGDDLKALNAFRDWMIAEHGMCDAVDVAEDYGFRWRHGATRFGVLGCDVATYTFNVAAPAECYANCDDPQCPYTH